MITTVIIDDDEIAVFVLVNMFKNLSSFEIQIVGTAGNLTDGVELIKSTHPDLVFLDINMPGKNGLEIFSEFKQPFFKIIFCSAYRQYAIDVLRFAASGYLLKPIDIIALQETLQKVITELAIQQRQFQFEDKLNYMFTPEMPGENLLFEMENGFEILNTRNIEYCHASQSYSTIVSYDMKEHLITKSLKELQEMLPEKQFYRTHKSFLVNVYYIRKYIHAKESYVLLKSGYKAPVSVRVTPFIVKDISDKLYN